MGVSPQQSAALDKDAVNQALTRLEEAVERAFADTTALAMVGIRRGGIHLAERLRQRLGKENAQALPFGTVDIALYRDDAAVALPTPKIGPSEIAFQVENRDILLVDDVLHTGRTVRAAIDAVFDYGRPKRIWLAVLFDRGGRELPIAADFVGSTINVSQGQLLRVDVAHRKAWFEMSQEAP